MPELPEVETIKRQLEERVVGRSIIEIEVRNEKSFNGNKAQVIHSTSSGQAGNKIVRIFRMGKAMVWEIQIKPTSNIQHPTSNNNLFLVFRLGMSGQILYVTSRQGIHSLRSGQASNKLETDKHVRVVFTLSDGSKVYFRDVRKFGRVRVLGDLGDLGNLGEEPLNINFTKEYFREILQKSKKAVKVFLMEQGRIAGIGNIYANEALFEAGILPTRPANSLSPKETEKLYNSIRKVLSDGIEHQGSSIKDKSYINAYGKIGSHQHHLKVYQRDGKECLVCGGVVKRMVVGGRGTFFCKECQK